MEFLLASDPYLSDLRVGIIRIGVQGSAKNVAAVGEEVGEEIGGD